MVPSMLAEEKLRAVQFWNVVSERLQEIVNNSAADLSALAFHTTTMDKDKMSYLSATTSQHLLPSLFLAQQHNSLASSPTLTSLVNNTTKSINQTATSNYLLPPANINYATHNTVVTPMERVTPSPVRMLAKKGTGGTNPNNKLPLPMQPRPPPSPVIKMDHSLLREFLESGRSTTPSSQTSLNLLSQTKENVPSPVVTNSPPVSSATTVPKRRLSTRGGKARAVGNANRYLESNLSPAILDKPNPPQHLPLPHMSSDNKILLPISNKPNNVAVKVMDVKCTNQDVPMHRTTNESKDDTSSDEDDTSFMDIVDIDRPEDSVSTEQCVQLKTSCSENADTLHVTISPSKTVQTKKTDSETNVKVEMDELAHLKSNYCVECKVTFATKANLTVHNRRHTGEKPFPCTLCAACFTTKGNLKRHIKAHSGDKPWSCSQCGSKFTEKKSLKVHMRRHTGEKPYVCRLCGKSFVQSGILQTHMAMHLGQRAHLCDLCGKSFRQKSQLRLHLQRHAGLRRFGCTQCAATFLTKGDLDRHMRIHTGERPFVCDLCGKSFTRQQSLNEHLNRHYGLKPYVCKVCGKAFAEMSACYKHVKGHHKKDSESVADDVAIQNGIEDTKSNLLDLEESDDGDVSSLLLPAAVQPQAPSLTDHQDLVIEKAKYTLLVEANQPLDINVGSEMVITGSTNRTNDTEGLPTIQQLPTAITEISMMANTDAFQTDF